MTRGEHTIIETAQPEEVLRSPARAWFTVGHLVAAAAMLALLALGLRVVSLRQVIDDAFVNPPVLRAVMQAAAGAPVSTVDVSKMLAGQATVSPFQARAMGRIAQHAGQWATAEAWLIQGLGDPDSDYLAQFELCLLYWNQGQRAHAREACRDTKASALYWLNRGYVADQNQERAEALAAFQMAGTVDPGMVAAWHQLGHALSASGRHEEAILAYERVLALTITPPADVFDSLGRAYLEVGNPTMSRDVINRGLTLYPSERVFYLAMAESYHQEGDLDTAESWYVRMLQRWPYDASVWAKRAGTAADAGRLRDAEAYYQEAVAIQPEDIGYWISLATVAVARDNKPLARDAYQKATDLRPDDVALWLQSGRYYAEIGWAADAREAFERVLELEPDNSEALNQLAALDGR